jgi:hypothetical protein
MSDHGKYSGGQGHEWRGDWAARLRDLLAARGFQRLTDYANTRPTATLDALADDLGVGDVAPIQVQWMLVDEARAAGQLERCARDLLSRRLSGFTWPADRARDSQKSIRRALLAWQGSLRDADYDVVLERIAVALLDATDIPASWSPNGPDDPIIVDAFERLWNEPKGPA